MIRLGDADLIDYTHAADPGYALLMWLGTKSGFNIWFVHLLGGGIFAYGLWRFCLNQPHPWLCMVVAIPYLVIVVAMGYDRQAVAIGLVMLAMVAIRHRSMLGFARSMALATTMHITVTRAYTGLLARIPPQQNMGSNRGRPVPYGGLPLFLAGYLAAQGTNS